MKSAGTHITTVTLNAAIDKTYFMPSLQLGHVNRVVKMSAHAGGKGINVARVAHLLGEEVLATGFVGGNAGQFIRDELTELGIRNQFVSVPGESRTCLNIIDESAGSSTELLEAGITIDQAAEDRLLQLLEEVKPTTSVLVVSGSLPRGASADLYSRIIRIWGADGAPVLLDTSGAPLLHAVSEAPPAMIKPNEEEMGKLLGASGSGETYSLKEAIAGLLRKGIRIAAVSLGAEGALVGQGDTLYTVGSVTVNAVNPVGSGDSFMAGAAVGLHRGYEIEQLLKLATACGASNCLHERTGWVDHEQVEQFMKQVQVVAEQIE